MFYEKLDEILKKKDLTMNKLAKNAGVAQASTVRWKNGSIPNADALIKICKYLNVSADYLLDLDTGQPPDILTAEEEELLNNYRSTKDNTDKQIILQLSKQFASKHKALEPQEQKYINSKIS